MGVTNGTDAIPHPVQSAVVVTDAQQEGSTDGTDAIPPLLHDAVEVAPTTPTPSTPPTSTPLMTQEQPASGSCSPTVESLEVDGPWSAPSQEECSVAAHLRREPQAPPHTPQADDTPVALAVDTAAATGSAKPSTLSLPTADPAAEVAADRSLEAPLLKAQLAAEGSGKQWLEDNDLSASKVPPQWIATMADDIALATSFWR